MIRAPITTTRRDPARTKARAVKQLEALDTPSPSSKPDNQNHRTPPRQTSTAVVNKHVTHQSGHQLVVTLIFVSVIQGTARPPGDRKICAPVTVRTGSWEVLQ